MLAPAGYVYVNESVTHTTRIGSPPPRASPGPRSPSQTRASQPPAPRPWFDNIIASASLTATEVTSASSVLLIANSSQVMQEFSYFAGGEQNTSARSSRPRSI
ncbi:hypothetical protein IWZ03DRAFT_418707 [Phyllosticta citriasiana]|uniref:Uncharacterized protein n=1 Tax=Phyllosticta citriasiana TaxID=595635 RepID=A0ABR1K8N1_9PEZI